MKKLLCVLLMLSLVLSLCIPAFAEQSHTVTSEAYPYYLIGEDTGKKMTLYFLDGVTDLSYMEVHDLCSLLNEIFEDEKQTVNFTVEIPWRTSTCLC